MKYFNFILFSGFLFVMLTACTEETTSISQSEVTIGVTAGPYEKIAEKAKEVAAENGLEINIKVFTDFITPNRALVEGDLDINFFQHSPFMNSYIEDSGEDVVSIAKTVLSPMGIYSKEIKSLDDVERGGKVALPSDPVNTGRALQLFERAGWITLKEGIGLKATLSDITNNPYELEFTPMDAAQIARVLDEFIAGAINPPYAIEEGYQPEKDAFLTETTNPNKDELAIVLAVRKENEKEAVFEEVVKALKSNEVKAFIEDEFEGSVVPLW